LAEVKAILKAIKAKDPEAACTASQEHVRKAATLALRTLSDKMT
jgi:DNA-binding GntR family transcriptional regulator